jgi:hypothetical protein
MKEITIYATVVAIDEDITKEEMVEGNLADLLDKTKEITFEKRNEIIKAFEEKGIKINDIICPDGFDGEKNQRNRKLLCEELRAEV